MNPRWLFQDGWSNGVIGNIQWYHLAEQAQGSLFNANNLFGYAQTKQKHTGGVSSTHFGCTTVRPWVNVQGKTPGHSS